MNFNSKKINRILIFFSALIVISILWSTYNLFQNFKYEERNKMELWSLATLELIDINSEISNLTLEVIKKNKSTPMIKVDNDGSIEINNINNLKSSDSLKVNQLIKKFKNENEPIKIFISEEHVSTLYYGNSSLLNRLKFYPFALLLIAIIFVFISYKFFNSSKIAEINLLWTSMAKETAHQIGTPLSSLMGWLELLKSSTKEKKYLNEIEDDILRLKVISERFSKIGSKPKLKKTEVFIELNSIINYLKNRVSKKIKFEIKKNKKFIYANLNSQLFGWCLENIIKNSIDSIKFKGQILIKIEANTSYIKIYIIDNGNGIDKKLKRKIFNPGVTSKERGWGLGLSLAKRIIKEYHQGEIKLVESEIGKGSTFMIKLRAIE